MNALIRSIRGAASLVLVVLSIAVVSWLMLDRLISVLERSVGSHSAAAVCCPTNSALTIYAQARQSQIASFDYKDALEVLRAEQSSWLSILGIFGVVIGLLVPTGAYLLQRQSLKDEQETIQKRIMDEVGKTSGELRKEIEVLKNDIRLYSGINDAKSEPFWLLMARTFERMLVSDAGKASKIEDPREYGMANFLLEIEHCLDAYIRAKNSHEVIRIYKTYEIAIDKAKRINGDDWHKATELIRGNPDQLISTAKWFEYEEVLKDSKGTLDWIKMLYAEFAPSKLDGEEGQRRDA